MAGCDAAHSMAASGCRAGAAPGGEEDTLYATHAATRPTSWTVAIIGAAAILAGSLAGCDSPAAAATPTIVTVPMPADLASTPPSDVELVDAVFRGDDAEGEESLPGAEALDQAIAGQPPAP